jgi:hypothetical protein
VTYGLQDRPLRVDRLFRMVGSLARDLLAIINTWKLNIIEDKDEQRIEGFANRLVSADWKDENLADHIKALQELEKLILKAANFPEPPRSLIPLASNPQVTTDSANHRWTIRLPLSKSLGQFVHPDSKIRIALNFDSATYVEVRVHPHLPWANIDRLRIVKTEHNTEALGLGNQFDGYFTFQPTKVDFEAAHIAFHTSVQPNVSDKNSVNIEEIKND